MEQLLTPIKFIEHRGVSGNSYWLFKCKCGKETITRMSAYKSGSTRSCGCLNSSGKIKHGLAKSRFANIHKGIKQRCEDKKTEAYKRYGAKGITCDWKNVLEFKKDMYESYIDHVKKFGEKNTTIDRVDNEKGYCKENCRWSTYKEQGRNRRTNVYIDGIVVAEFAEKNNIPPNTANQRRVAGWDIEEIINGKHHPSIGETHGNEINFKECKIYIMEQFKRNADIVKAYLGILGSRDKEVMEKRLGIIDGKKHTLEEIGKDLGITRERVRQIEFKALKKMSVLESEIKADI